MQTGLTRKLFRYLAPGLFCFLHVAHAETEDLKPAVAVIIDDIGYRYQSSRAAVSLNGAFTCSILPYTPHSQELAELAYNNGKEIMLHLPMQSVSQKNLGPGGLTDDMQKEQFFKTLHGSLNAIPHIVGFNNHMGSYLTSNREAMNRLMGVVAVRGNLFFVDSKTSSDTVADEFARKFGIPSIVRDVFIDHEEDAHFIRQQLQRLEKKARQNGTAIGIAHPKKLSIEMLQQWQQQLDAKGIRLVNVSELIRLKQQRRIALWQESSSR